MLPPLVSLPEFEARVPGGIAAADEVRAEHTLIDASSLVRAEAGKTWVDDVGALEGVPDVVVMVTCAAARRALINPEALTGESVAGYSATYSSASPDVYLTKNEKQIVRRAAGRTGVWALATTRTDVGPDVPSVLPDGLAIDASEEVDPFGEGWTG